MTEQKRTSPYVVIYLDARKTLKLSMTEYALVEMIDRLAGAKSASPGWCFASKNYLANALGITERSVYSNLIKLVDLGLIERHQERNQLLRPTAMWTSCVQQFRSRGAA